MAEGSPADPAHFFARVLADQHYQKGLQRQEQGTWDLALVSYRRACALDPHNVLYLLARGHVCQTHGLEAEAEECYRVALRLRPDDAVALFNQAQLFAARGQLEEARGYLGKIVGGGVESLGERAAPVHARLGDIALRREDYLAAAVHFRRALECLPGQRYATAALDGLQRFAEFRRPFDPAGGIQPKIAFYGYAGAILLGLPEDDGMAIPAYPALGFESLAEVAQTLTRFTGLALRLGWAFDVVVALEAQSLPLAIALAGVFGARPLAPGERGQRGACALGVTGTASDPAALEREAGATREWAGRTLLYGVGVDRPVWEYAAPVQVASAPTRLEFPWSRGEAAAAEHAEAIGAELHELLQRAPADATVGAQLSWYGGQAGHARLRFDPLTLEARPSELDDRRLLDCIA